MPARHRAVQAGSTKVMNWSAFLATYAVTVGTISGLAVIWISTDEEHKPVALYICLAVLASAILAGSFAAGLGIAR